MTKNMVVDELEFSTSFPWQPFTVRHHLADNPAFSLSRLIELSKRLPEKHVEYNAGEASISQDPNKTPRTGLSIEETIRRIEECRSWLVMKYIETDTEYCKLLDACLDEIRDYSDPVVGQMMKREGFIFISSAKSVTPFHIDPEHNFLLQIRGTKQVHLFDHLDREILPEEQIEKFYGGAHRNLTYKEEYQQRATSFTLTPGDALHFPVNAPHWVDNGDAVSISFSITFRSPLSEKRSRLYRANALLRDFGMKPTPVGSHAWLDSTKDTTYRVYRKARHLFRGQKNSGVSEQY